MNIALDIKLPLASIVAHVANLAEDWTFIPRPVVNASHAPSNASVAVAVSAVEFILII